MAIVGGGRRALSTLAPRYRAALFSLSKTKFAQPAGQPDFRALGKAKVVVPLSLFAPPQPEAWRPQHHLYYDRRVLDVSDDLPKYRTHFGSTLWEGEPPEAEPPPPE